MTVQRRSYPVPTPRFAALVAGSSAVLPLMGSFGWGALLATGSVLLSLAGSDVLVCVSPRRIRVDREIADTVVLGSSCEIHWTIENRSRRSARVTVADALWPSLGASSRRVTARIGAGRRHRSSATLVPSRRGRFPLRDVTVRVVGPLGLAARQVRHEVPGGLRVLPAHPSRHEVRRRLRHPRLADSGARSARAAGAGRDFDQLRDYRPDDEFARIDWAATVRMQRPIVRQYRTEQHQQVVVLLDNGRVMAGHVDGVPRVEHAMDAVFGLVQAVTHLGDRIGLVAFDSQVRQIVAPSSAVSQASTMSEAMFALDARYTESDYHAAVALAAARFRRRSLFVVLTDLVEAAVDQSLLPALVPLTRTHLVLVAAVSDPTVETWSAGVGPGPCGPFRAAAAVRHLEHRATTAARLRAAGAVVVDAAPGRLAIEVVDRYLELKAAGRL